MIVLLKKKIFINSSDYETASMYEYAHVSIWNIIPPPFKLESNQRKTHKASHQYADAEFSWVE